MTYLLPAFTSAPAINAVHNVDALTLLRAMPDSSVNTIVTSPPYFGLRSYLPDGSYNKVLEIGLEPTPQSYVAVLTGLFHEARRVLRADGTLWLNIGDSYNNSGKGGNPEDSIYKGYVGNKEREQSATTGHGKQCYSLPEKSLLGIPWRVAFALQDDGWILRSDIIWAKPNPMPESVTDRPTKSHEYVFLFAKSPRYYYDAAAIAEPALYAHEDRRAGKGRYAYQGKWNGKSNGEQQAFVSINETRNKRDVWTVNPQPFSGSHFATFPPALIEPMILAGCPVGGLVLDPFMGAGTTAVVAQKLGRNYIGSELNPEYVEMAHQRIQRQTLPLPLFDTLIPQAVTP